MKKCFRRPKLSQLLSDGIPLHKSLYLYHELFGQLSFFSNNVKEVTRTSLLPVLAH